MTCLQGLQSILLGEALNTRASGQVAGDTLNIGIAKTCALTFTCEASLDAVALSGSVPR